METSKLAIDILRKFYGSNVGVVLVEGIPPQEYLASVRVIEEQFLRLEKPLSRDFLEMIAKDHEALLMKC